MTDLDESPAVSAQLAVARRAASAGAGVAADRFRTELAVETKADEMDLVTEADRAAQRAVREVIDSEAPAEPFVGEEDATPDGPTAVPETGSAWIVDPIDGTANFVRGIPFFATAVAAVERGEPVAAAVEFPALDDVYWGGPDGASLNGDPLSVSDRSNPEACAVCPTLAWSRDRREEYARVAGSIVTEFGDLRRFGCAQAELAMVASGALDATIGTGRASPWDTVAGVLLVRAAGGRVTDIEGDRWRHDSVGLVASNGAIHDEALAAARSVDDGSSVDD